MPEVEQAANAVETTDGLATQDTDQQVVQQDEQAGTEQKAGQQEDITQTKAFSERLKDSTSKAVDKEYEKLYGSYGIHSKADYDRYIAEQEEKKRNEELQNSGIDPDVLKEAIASDPDVQWAKTFREKQEVENFRSKVKEEKASLKDKLYFNELESEIDTLIETSLQNGKFVNAETAFYFLRGQKADELNAKTKGQTEKQILANVQDRSNRGLTGSSDFSGDNIDYSDVDVNMATAFGNDPKKIAAYVAKAKKEMKR